ncbi:hypothetical protein PLEOSDRAFT_1109861 [Pleurotus ostreatus PC15]|uniref:Uncharacterized protein n=1 Tax=Pleurotus ostreatus (strain PC15) TaxID=1137138 RepID=A0A067N427_PLEO1|nr:hypothetical protein PLEOSDRAFT_1109861 [Pleurotus ostreatus PC15]
MTTDDLQSTTSLGLTLEGPSTGAPQPLTLTPTTRLGKRRRGESTAGGTAIPQNPPSSVDSVASRSAPSSHAHNTSRSLENQRPIWLRDVISFIKRYEGNIESKVVNAGAREDIKDTLTDGFMVMLFMLAYMNNPADSEELDGLAKVFSDGTTPLPHTSSRKRVVRLSPVILEYLRETQEAAGGEMMKEMEQEAYAIVLGKVEEAERKAEEARDNGNGRTSEKPPSVGRGVRAVPNDTEDGASRANHLGADPGDGIQQSYNTTSHQAPQADIVLSGVARVYSQMRVFITDHVTGQIRYLSEEERHTRARLEHCRRVEEAAQRAEAQVRRVAVHATRIAEHNREVAERDRMIAEEMMAEQARRDADRTWVESMTQLMQSPGHPHSYNYAPEFQSAYANAPPQASYAYYPQPPYYGQAPPGYTQCMEPHPGHPPQFQVAYYLPAPGTQAPGYGVPPLTYHQHYGSGPSETNYTQ